MTPPSPIVLTAFSTSETATTIYRHIEAAVHRRYPEQTIYWGYNRRSVIEAGREGHGEKILPTTGVLARLAAQGVRSAIVQSLHLMPGMEFHDLCRNLREVTGIVPLLGTPLCSTPRDFRQMVELLLVQLGDDPDQAILCIGHGTRHPSWTGYIALESFLRDRLGKRAFVGCVEHYPQSTGVVHEIARAGYRKVLLVPFFFSGGIHVRRDMLGKEPESWKSRLEQVGLEVASLCQGIGQLPGIEDLIARHIAEASEIL